MKEERDRLIQISNDLRADLNRSQRLVNDLMNREMSGAGAGQASQNQNQQRMQVHQRTPEDKKNYMLEQQEMQQ